MSDERRRNSRITTKLEMAVEFEGNFFGCEMQNISESGVLASIQSGDTSLLKPGQIVHCLFSYGDSDFDGKARVMRATPGNIALEFWALDVDQVFVLRRIISDNAD